VSDPRIAAPAASRNRDPILEVLRRVLPPRGRVLELASGSGEHALHFARALPGITFQPSDPDEDRRASIAAYVADAGPANLLPPIELDATGTWAEISADAVLCINMVHIAPWAAAEGLVRGAAKLGAMLVTYGPYRRRGIHTAPSNAAFDADLRGRNPAWGIRDLEAIAGLAGANGYAAPEIVPMPANNFMLVFRHPAIADPAIRTMRDEDTEDVIALWHAAGVARPWNDPATDIAFARRGPNATILVMEQDGSLVASAMVGEDGHRGWVYYVATTPALQGRGLGGRMMAAAEAWLAARGVWKVQLLVRDGNEKARAFYDRLGYRNTGSVSLQKIIEPAR
jgi:ribosomal protein S18 acetylase RimI-like enzyme